MNNHKAKPVKDPCARAGVKSGGARVRESASELYEAPRIVTFSRDELMKELGPARACNPFGGSVVAC